MIELSMMDADITDLRSDVQELGGAVDVLREDLIRLDETTAEIGRRLLSMVGALNLRVTELETLYKASAEKINRVERALIRFADNNAVGPHMARAALLAELSEG